MTDKQKLALIRAVIDDFFEYGEDQSAKTVLYVIDTVLEFGDPKNEKRPAFVRAKTGRAQVP